MRFHACSDIEEADSPGAVQLVAAGAEHVNVALVHLNRQMAKGLNRVCVEQDSMLLRNGADLLDGLNGSNLIIRKHDGN